MYIDVNPGFFAEWNREVVAGWAGVTTTGPVKGLHFAQEDSGEHIGRLVADFVQAC